MCEVSLCEKDNFAFLLGLLSSQGIISVGLEVQFPDKLCLKGSHFQFLQKVN